MKKFDTLLPMNLQFFAEGEGSEVSETTQEVAAPETEETVSEGTEDTGVEEVESTEPQPQSPETNRAFAEMRRRMEAAERRQKEVDERYAQQFGGYTNPETGQPIRSAEDYMEAMAAQERVKAREQLQQNNIDPSLIDNLIANSPVVRQAQEATKELNQYRIQQQINEDLNKILALDSSYDSIESLMKDPVMNEVASYIESHPGVRADEAFKIVNYDRLKSSAVGAAKQAAVNQVKSKNHLNTGASLSVDDSLEDIPADQLEMYKEAFPGKPLKEIKALYNKAISLRRS